MLIYSSPVSLGSIWSTRLHGLRLRRKQVWSGLCLQSDLSLKQKESSISRMRYYFPQHSRMPWLTLHTRNSKSSLRFSERIYHHTVIDLGCWYQVFAPKVPSGRSDHGHGGYWNIRCRYNSRPSNSEPSRARIHWGIEHKWDLGRDGHNLVKKHHRKTTCVDSLVFTVFSQYIWLYNHFTNLKFYSWAK